MRKFILFGLIAATALPGIASAQTAELRRDRQDIREEQRELREAQRYGDRRDIREERQDLREARREYREDWREYRREHRDAYRRPAYRGPRGYRYHRIEAGRRLPPAYFRERYVIADPYRYRLPRPHMNQRWIRYGNDVLLVNMRSGQVNSVYHDFFW